MSAALDEVGGGQGLVDQRAGGSNERMRAISTPPAVSAHLMRRAPSARHRGVRERAPAARRSVTWREKIL